MNKNNTNTTLSSPGEAAKYLELIMRQSDWGMINMNLNELQRFIPYFKPGWDKEISTSFLQLIIECKNNIGNSFDLITALTADSYLIITQEDRLTLWEDELNKHFISLIIKEMPNKYYGTQVVVVLNNEIFPLPSLTFGIVTSKDKTFSKPVEIYQTALDNRKNNERSKLLFQLRSLSFNQSKLNEESLMIKSDPYFYSLILEFTKITTGHLHDIRNGVNILSEQYLRLNIPKKTIKLIQNSIQFISLLLETISEIRFRGTDNLEKVNLNELISEKIDSFRFGSYKNIDFKGDENSLIVYTKPSDITLSLFVFLLFLKKILKKENILTIACGIKENKGFIKISGEYNISINEIISGESEIYKENDYWPYIYIFHKIIKRLYGSIEVNLNTIYIYLPLYEYQDVLSLSSIKKQIDEIRIDIDILSSKIEKEEKVIKVEGLITKAMELAAPLLTRFIEALQNYMQIVVELLTDSEDSENILEMLLAGSRYCILLVSNLLTLKGEYIKTTEKTNVKKVLTLVESILHYKLSQIAEFELSIKDNLPDVHATETALAQVIMNLVMNSLEELARVTPPISRLFISAKEEDTFVVISILDTGAGISDTIIESIMDNKQGISQEKGGIGLYVVKSIIDSFGARLYFKVNPQKGTTVKIYLRKWEDTE